MNTQKISLLPTQKEWVSKNRREDVYNVSIWLYHQWAFDNTDIPSPECGAQCLTAHHPAAQISATAWGRVSHQKTPQTTR